MRVNCDGIDYEVHTTGAGQKHSHFVVVNGKIIGSVSRLVTWDAVLDTGARPHSLELLSTHTYRKDALEAVVRGYHSLVMTRARARLKVRA